MAAGLTVTAGTAGTAGTGATATGPGDHHGWGGAGMDGKYGRFQEWGSPKHQNMGGFHKSGIPKMDGFQGKILLY